MPQFNASENEVFFCSRAKYIPLPDGSCKLAQVQHFTAPRFRKGGWEEDSSNDFSLDTYVSDTAGVTAAPEDDSEKLPPDHANIIRASRRAKINAFDTILCNPSLDTFATFTYRPDDSLDKASYDQCYDVLRPWLSNRVQRRGLQYIIVPERHKSGDIHFHGILNSSALKLTRAHSPNTGRALSRNGSPIYNLDDWREGFSTAQIIGGGADDREKVAKYVFKYMGKQLGERIGGRYALIGGKGLLKPVYVYGNTPDELCDPSASAYSRVVEVSEGLTYSEYSFL